MRVSVVSELYVPMIFGVELSVLGGAPQVDQPPPGTVWTSRFVERLTVNDPPLSEAIDVPFVPGIEMTVVSAVYVEFG